MTILECINRIDLVKPNTYTQDEKVRWLSVIDGLVKKNIIDRHEGADAVVFNGYDKKTELSTVLLVPEPFEEIYLFGLAARIDYWNGENDKYNDSIDMYNKVYLEYSKEYTEHHRPITGKRFIF